MPSTGLRSEVLRTQYTCVIIWLGYITLLTPIVTRYCIHNQLTDDCISAPFLVLACELSCTIFDYYILRISHVLGLRPVEL